MSAPKVGYTGNMTTIHVLAGGSSAEREVSLRSGAAVQQALQAAGYATTLLDPADVPLDDIVACDVVFLALHGAGGEDGTLQAQLDQRGAHYTGPGAAASALCFDKWQYRQCVQNQDIPMAEGALVTADSYRAHPLAQEPFVIKPVASGSSIDTYIVRDVRQAPHTEIAEALERHQTMLMERLIVGTELTVGILGDTPLPVVEIIPPADAEFDYEHKYDGSSQELCPPPHLSADVQQRAQGLALRAHQATGCRDISRTDMICTPNSELYVLETNTLPGMTEHSIFPKMAAAADMTMPQLCSRLVELAMHR
jgi:D-alanine-D-alanine ligase